MSNWLFDQDAVDGASIDECAISVSPTAACVDVCHVCSRWEPRATWLFLHRHPQVGVIRTNDTDDFDFDNDAQLLSARFTSMSFSLQVF